MSDGASNVGIVAVVDVAQHESNQESGEEIHDLWIKMKESESQR
jgi:hypothetical protein